MRYRPGRGMGAADPGSHRYSGSPIPGHRAGLHCPDLPGVRGEAGSPGGPERRGRGPAALGGQPGQPDNSAARRGASARSGRPVVSPNGPPVAPKRRRHRAGHPWGGPTGPTGAGPGAGSNTGQPGSPCRRNRAGARTGPTGTSGPSPLPPSGTSCGGAGTRRWWTRRWASPSAEGWSVTSTPPIIITPA